MKSRDEEWGPGPDFGPPPPPGKEMPIEEQTPPEDEPMSFRLMRRIEYTGRIHHMAFRSILREDGLPPAQASAWRFIIRFPGMIQRELADRLHIQRATVTVMLPPGTLYFTAFSQRLRTVSLKSRRTPVRVPAVPLTVSVTFCACAAADREAAASCASESSDTDSLGMAAPSSN